MKKIVLIGDSIRMGYDKYVKEKLEGQAEVLFPEENCQFAMYVFRYIHEWKANYNWGDDVDLVHWNTGLWDILHLLGDDMFTPPELYRELLQRIDKRLDTGTRRVTLHIPYDKGSLLDVLYREAKVESVGYSETIDVVAVCDPRVLGQMAEYVEE